MSNLALSEVRDILCPAWDDLFGPDNPSARLVRDLYFTEVHNRLPPGSWVLNVGCATGLDAVELARSGVKVWAVDWSPRMVEATVKRARAAGVESRLVARAIPPGQILSTFSQEIPNERLDGVVAPWGILNLEPDLPGLFDTFYQLLRPSGRVFTSLLNPRSLTGLMGALKEGQLGETLARARAHGDTRGQWRVAEGLPPMEVNYPSLEYLHSVYGTRFELEKRKVAGSVSAPSSSGLLRGLRRLEGVLSHLPIQSVSDQSVLVFRRSVEGMWGPAGPHLLANE